MYFKKKLDVGQLYACNRSSMNVYVYEYMINDMYGQLDPIANVRIFKLYMPSLLLCMATFSWPTETPTNG